MTSFLDLDLFVHVEFFVVYFKHYDHKDLGKASTNIGYNFLCKLCRLLW